MQRILQYGVSVCALFLLSETQNVGHVDLSYQRESRATSTAAETIPGGCEKIASGIIGDGWPMPEDKVPREITVSVISVNDTKPALGSELLAEVELQNNDTHPIAIPWSTDWNLVWQGQDPSDLRWGAGTFKFTVRNQERGHVMLVSRTEWLYSSKSYPDSFLTLQPGQSFTATVRLKIENQFEGASPGRLKEGEWQLFANWEQVDRALSVKNCKGISAYYYYDYFYKQTNLPITLHIASAAPASATKPVQ